ncbi:hypothetical protein JQX13_02155 [Archangium violaceum]|uniref:SitI6 family double-CXXCG motif immunity protein n=1 Tax=Archangium violaceum TaxID=83451 RepID=UPI00193BDEB6|nr:double-CXXCG motif protein [Archangium violaceum]QRK08995.1 hypothetical protein JQX13_02155 [Archangium violaceum]
MRYFRIKGDRGSDYTGYIDGSYKWGLPGIICPACKATWSAGSKAYPSVDLTPVAFLADFEKARAEPLDEYERLSELVRPLLPPGAVLEPGATFGSFVGRAQGFFGPLVSPDPWWLLVRREALEKLQAEGVRGLKGCPTVLRFRQRNSPELLDLELLPVGCLHPDCLPTNRKPACPRCGRNSTPLPDDLMLDATTLPSHLDLFRLEDYSSVIICTERFVDACRRLGLDGVVFHPLPAR